MGFRHLTQLEALVRWFQRIVHTTTFRIERPPFMRTAYDILQQGREFAPNENDAEKGSNAKEMHSVVKLDTKGQVKPDFEGFSQPLPKSESDIEPFAQFCSDSANVWKLYMDRAKIWDDELANILNGDLDPLLIFAGLFSAILAAFLIEIRKGLQEDLQDTTNALLRILIQDQQNMTIVPTLSRFEPTASSRWINGLWFCSLIFSLMSALGASLAKGWVTQYSSTGFGTTWRDAASHRRRFNGMIRWRMKVIIQGLPIFIHIAFFLFAAGLAILLFNDDVGIAGVVLALIIVIVLLYLAVTVHTHYRPDSPFRTPVSNIVNWLIERYKACPQSSPRFSNSSDDNSFKAQSLGWLLEESADAKVIVETVRAIAGLSATPTVQDELYRHSIVTMLSRGLSASIDRKGDDSDVLSVYLHAILRLVQVGPRVSEVTGDSVSPVLASLVDIGGLLHISACHKLEAGLFEVALCVNARIHLMLDKQRDETLFNTDIPILLRSATEPHIRRLLLEVQILDTAKEGNYLECMKNIDFSIRQNGHDALAAKARSDEIILTSVSTFGIATLVKGLSSTSFKVCCEYLDKCADLCVYEAFRKQLCHDHNGLKQLYDMLWGQDNILRKKTIYVLLELSRYGNTWEVLDSFTAQHETLIALENYGEGIYEALRVMMLRVVEHDELRSRIVTTELVNFVLFNDRVKDWGLTLKVIKALIAYDDIRRLVITLTSLNMMSERLRDSDISDLHEGIVIIQELANFSDTRALLTTTDVVHVLLRRLSDDDRYTRQAVTSSIVELARHDEARVLLVTMDVVQVLLTSLSDDDSKVRQTVIIGVVELAKHDETRALLMTTNTVHALLARLCSNDPYVRRIAVESIVDFAKFDETHALFMTVDVVQALLTMLDDKDLGIRRRVIDSVLELVKHDDTRVLLMATEVLQTLLTKLSDNNSDIQRAVIDSMVELAKYNETRTLIIADTVQALLTGLSTNYSIVREAIIGSIGELIKHDETRALFITADVVQILLTQLNGDDQYVRRAAIDSIKGLASHDETCALLMTTDTVQAVLVRLGSNDRYIRRVSMDTIVELARRDKSRALLMTTDVIQTLLIMLRDNKSNVRQAMVESIMELAKHDETRTLLITTEVLHTLLTMLSDNDPDVRRAVINSFVELAKHNETHALFVTMDIVQALLTVSNDNDSNVWQTVIAGIRELAKLDETRVLLITTDVMQTLLTTLSDNDSNVRHAAITSTMELAKHDETRTLLMPMDVVRAILTTLSDDDSDVRQVVVDSITELLKHDETYVLPLMTTDIIQALLIGLSDHDRYVRWAVIKSIVELAKHNGTRALLITTNVVQALLTMLNVINSDVRVIDSIMVLAKHDETRVLFITTDVVLAILTTLSNNNLPVQRAAINSIVELAKHGETRALLMITPVVGALLTTLGGSDSNLQQAAIDSVIELAKHHETQALVMTEEVVRALVANTNDDRPELQRIVCANIAELATHMPLVAQELIDTIVNMASPSNQYNLNAIEFLIELAKYDPIHPLAEPIFNSIIGGLKTAKSLELQRTYGTALADLLDIVGMSDTDAIAGRVIALLSDQDPVVVKVSIPTIPSLAKRLNGKKYLCQSPLLWKHLVGLLDNHDTRSDAIWVFRVLQQHDDLLRAMKHNNDLVMGLLNMLKSQEIERWTIAAEGLLLLGLF